MNLTERDRRIVIFLIPIVVLVAFWFLLLAPKREEAAKVGTQLTEEQSKRDTAEQKATALQASKTSFAADYGTVLQLGKAVPSSVDMPSLIIQLQEAAGGAGIDFDSIRTGVREAAPPPAPAPPAGGETPSGNTQPASGPGQAAASADGAADAAGGGQAATPPADPAQPGGPPTGSPGAPAAAAAPGLDTVPLEFSFRGSYFELADMFHRFKRFVKLAGEDIRVQGRLMTIEGFTFTSGESFPELTAEVTTTVYLTPRAQGTTAGATPAGPAAPPAPGAPQTASTPAPPTAAATP